MEGKKLRLKLSHTSSATDEACLLDYVRNAMQRSKTDRLPEVARSCRVMAFQPNKPTSLVQDMSEAANLLLKADKRSTDALSSARDISHRLDRRSQSQLTSHTNDIVKLANLPSSTLNLPKNISELRTGTRQTQRHKPTGRREAELLTEWLDSMLKEVSKDKDLESIFTEVELILKSCYDELVAQVTVQCNERGALLRRVWDAYVGMLERSLISIKRNKVKEINELKARIATTEQAHRVSLREIEERLAESEKERSNLEAEIRVRMRAQHLHMQRERKLSSRLEIIQNYYESNKQKVLILTEKLRVAKIELENKGSDYSEDEEGNIIKTKRQKKFKQRNKREILRDVKLDPAFKGEVLEDSDLEEDIGDYDNYLEIKYESDDFKDKSTDTSDFVKVDAAAETTLEDCCGEALGEKAPMKKKRRTQTDVKELCGVSEGVPKGMMSSLKPVIPKLVFTPPTEDNSGSPISPNSNILADSEQLIKQIQAKYPIPEIVKEMISSFVRRATISSTPVQNSSDIAEDSEESELEELPETNPVERKRRKTKTNFTEIVAFRLNKRRSTVRPTDSHAYIIQRVLSTPVHSIKNVTIKKMLLKMISAFYDEKLIQLQENLNEEQNMAEFVFQQCLNKYGYMKTAEQKFTQIIGSCLKFRECLKIETFGRFLGLYEPLEAGALNLYLKALEFLKTGKKGKDTPWVDYEEFHYSPYCRAEACVKAFYENKQNYLEVYNSLLKLKLDDPSGANPSGLIEAEGFLKAILDAHAADKARLRLYVKRVFEAADLNGDSFLQFGEFELLSRYLSPLTEVREMFDNFADINTDEGINAITFENFLELVKTHPEIFPIQRLYDFAGLTSDSEAEAQLQLVRDKLDFTVNQLKWRWPSIDIELLDCLTVKILQPDEPFAVWLGLRLLEEDSKRFKVKELVEKLLPEVASVSN